MRALILLLMLVSPALAHGPAKWIQDGNFKNAVGDLCCGENDCGLHVGGTIIRVQGGYRVNADFRIGDGPSSTVYHVMEFVPDSDATPSPTGDYWRCAWGGTRKCFFTPPPSM